MNYFFAIFLIIFAFAVFSVEDKSELSSRHNFTHPSAIQFIQVRSDIINYLKDKNNHRDGIINYNSIYPDSFFTNDTWNIRIESKTCYIWGESNNKVYTNIFDLTSHSISIGISHNGIIKLGDVNLPSPAFIPNGSIVSVIDLS